MPRELSRAPPGLHTHAGLHKDAVRLKPDGNVHHSAAVEHHVDNRSSLFQIDPQCLGKHRVVIRN